MKIFKILFFVLLTANSAGNALAQAAPDNFEVESELTRLFRKCKHPGWNREGDLSDHRISLMILNENNCLEQQIEQQLDKLFDNEEYRNQVSAELQNITKGYQQVYLGVFNNNRYCHRGENYYDCGQKNVDLGNRMWHEALKTILENVVRQNKMFDTKLKSSS